VFTDILKNEGGIGFGLSLDGTAYFRMAVFYLNMVFAVAKIRFAERVV